MFGGLVWGGMDERGQDGREGGEGNIRHKQVLSGEQRWFSRQAAGALHVAMSGDTRDLRIGREELVGREVEIEVEEIFVKSADVMGDEDISSDSMDEGNDERGGDEGNDDEDVGNSDEDMLVKNIGEGNDDEGNNDEGGAVEEDNVENNDESVEDANISDTSE